MINFIKKFWFWILALVAAVVLLRHKSASSPSLASAVSPIEPKEKPPLATIPENIPVVQPVSNVIYQPTVIDLQPVPVVEQGTYQAVEDVPVVAPVPSPEVVKEYIPEVDQRVTPMIPEPDYSDPVPPPIVPIQSVCPYADVVGAVSVEDIILNTMQYLDAHGSQRYFDTVSNDVGRNNFLSSCVQAGYRTRALGKTDSWIWSIIVNSYVG
jgi:hypothetical protein